MEKEDLVRIIKEELEDLDQRIEEIDKNILYKQELISLNKKFSKSTYECEKEIEKLNIQKETMQIVKEAFLETMNEYDIDFDDIKDYIAEC